LFSSKFKGAENEPMDVQIEDIPGPKSQTPPPDPSNQRITPPRPPPQKFSEIMKNLKEPIPQKSTQTDLTTIHLENMDKRIKELVKTKDFYRKKVHDMKRSREKIKSKTEPRQYHYRETILTPEEDLLFTLEFNLTGKKRKKMKKVMRQYGVDLLVSIVYWRSIF